MDIPQPQKEASALQQPTTVLQEMKAGLQYVLNWRGMLYIVLFAMLLNFVLSPAASLLPLLIKDHFNGGAVQLGWANSVFGVGVLVGGAILGIWGGFKRRIYTSLVGILGIGLGALLMGVVPGNLFYLALLANLILGVGQPIANGALGAIMQATIEPQYQGRVFTLLSSGAMAMMPLGLAIAGPLSDWLGIQIWFVIGGVTCLVMTLLMFGIPAVRNVEQGRQLTEQPAIEIKQV